MLIQIILLTTLGSVVSLFGGFLLLLRKNWNTAFSLLLTSFAAGVLLATAFLDLFPESMEHLKEIGGGDVFVPALVGIICFFLLERTLIWFHHHHGAHGIKPTVWMITLGDGVHNFIDGLAIAAHEIPQEIADFSVLLSRGLSKRKAVIFNVASALTALVGAVGMYLFSEILEMHLGFITAFAAGMFVYIALSDLIPELHHSENKKETGPQIVAFV